MLKEDEKLVEELQEKVITDQEAFEKNPVLQCELFDMFNRREKEEFVLPKRHYLRRCRQAQPIIPIPKLIRQDRRLLKRVEINVSEAMYYVLRQCEKRYKVKAEVIIDRILTLFFRM